MYSVNNPTLNEAGKSSELRIAINEPNPDKKRVRCGAGLFPKSLLLAVNTDRKPPAQQEQHYLHTLFPTNRSNFHQQVHLLH